MTYKLELYNAIKTTIQGSTAIREAAGTTIDKPIQVWYRYAQPKTKFPYLVVDINREETTMNPSISKATLFIDVWDIEDTGIRAENVTVLVQQILHSKRITVEDLVECRVWHDYTVNLPVEKKDGAVDYRLHRLEIIFNLRLGSIQKNQAAFDQYSS